MDYVIAVQAPAYDVSPTSFATESAFAAHLKELRHQIGNAFRRVILISPRMSDSQYESQKAHLTTLDTESDEVSYVPAFPVGIGAATFWWSHARALRKRLKQAVADAAIVHSGMSTDVYRPLMAMTNRAARRAGRPVVFVVDIDFRKHSWRNYKLGTWNLKQYLVNRLLHDPFKWIQCWLAPRAYDLVLFKSESMVRDFGRGRPNVKNFFDTVHTAEQVLDGEGVAARQTRIRDESTPLHLVYFGRLVAYKGLDRAVEAIGLVRDRGRDVRLTIIGNGDRSDALKEQVRNANLTDRIAFHPQVPYGPELFALLDRAHLSIATPLVEDTPRSAFDSFAVGLPILAFDITYFRDLAGASGAVILVQWPSAESFAEQILTWDRRRDQLADMAGKAVAFAAENTQRQWLERRFTWTMEFAMRKLPPRQTPSP